MSSNGHHPPYAVRLTIPAKPEYITLGRLALSGIARAREGGVPAEVLGDLKLALTEACTNSVRHAYDGGSGTVEIVYELHPDKLVVVVADQGEGFTYDLDATDNGDGELTEGGLGIAIIDALADELEIAPREHGGASLRFVKKLDA
ncbi:MAG TPA: ATP-binding protein [Gaiellaceae bacterium]|nr:ATP-binding protein [Gaiellaceae bacterium]